MNIWQAVVKLVEPFHRRKQSWFALAAICVIALAMIVPFTTLIVLRVL